MSASDSIRRVVVLGAGALGSLLGGKLSAACPVLLVGRPAHLAAIRAGGLRLGGLSERTVLCGPNLALAEDLQGPACAFQPGDAVLLAVKAGSVAPALRELAAARKASAQPGAARTPLFAFQNGTGFEERLRSAAADGFEPHLAVAHLGATFVAPGSVEDWGGEVLLPEAPAGRALATLLGRAGIQARVLGGLEVWRWKKIAFNCALNALSALLGVRNRETIVAEWRPLRRAVLEEVRALAEARGVALPPLDALLEEFERRAAASNNVNSMLQDLRRGRPTEIGFLNGALVRQARARGQAAPHNEALAEAIARLEALTPELQARERPALLERLHALVHGGVAP